MWGRGGTLDSFSDVHYFTGHYSPMVWVPPVPGLLTACEHAGVVLDGRGEATLLVTGFLSEQASVEEVRSALDLGAELVASVQARGLSASRVGVIGTEVLPYAIAERLREACPAIRLEPADEISAELRLRLSDTEVELLRRAGRVGLRVLEAALAAAVPGATEGDMIGAGLAEAARIPGCAHWAFLAASGPDAHQLVRNALPPWNPGYRYRHGDVVHPDCFGFVHGYAYDLARTAVVGGEPTTGQAVVAAGARAACDAMAAALGPGATPADLYASGIAALEEAGLLPVASGFGHALGAGFFRPLVLPTGPDARRALQPPLALAFEVFATNGKGDFAFHEDEWLLLESGTECLTG